MWLEFLVTYDANRMATYEVPVRINRDLSGRTVSFVLGERVSSRSAALSDNVIVGVTREGYLSEFRLVNLKISFD